VRSFALHFLNLYANRPAVRETDKIVRTVSPDGKNSDTGTATDRLNRTSRRSYSEDRQPPAGCMTPSLISDDKKDTFDFFSPEFIVIFKSLDNYSYIKP